MAEENDSQGEKTEEPSQYRIDEFREKGVVPLSREVVNVLVLAASIITLLLSSSILFNTLHEYIEWIMTLEYKTLFTFKKFPEFIEHTVKILLISIAPVLLSSFCFSIIAHLFQVGIVFSPQVLELKWERVNPISGIGRLFSKKMIYDFFKVLLKFILMTIITYYLTKEDVKKIGGFSQLTYLESFNFGKAILFKISISIIVGLSVVAFIDLAWERYSYRQKLLQTKQQIKEESKEKEGNPEIKQKIRSIQREMAQKRMMGEVKSSDVIITNPTHYSVAVKYSSESMAAPRVVAKGKDELALRIRKIAKEAKIPIVENVTLARTLYATVDVGQTIPRSLYKVVAEILAFVYKKRKKDWESIV